MTEALCRGSLLLGSGCGRCDRCRSERERLLRKVAVCDAAMRLYRDRILTRGQDERPLAEMLVAACQKLQIYLDHK